MLTYEDSARCKAEFVGENRDNMMAQLHFTPYPFYPRWALGNNSYPLPGNYPVKWWVTLLPCYPQAPMGNLVLPGKG